MTLRSASQAGTPTSARLNLVLAQLGRIVVGKDEPLRLALACLLARGHLLIEDIPGVGKSTLAQALSATLGLKYARVQFTSDLLPADVLGVSIYDERNQSFRFHPGPIFNSVVLADEINRAPPKTQSALLEAMEERQVSLDGQTRKLPEPFFVIATQNPIEQIGAYPLPESQLDRFLMAIELGLSGRGGRARTAGRRRPPRPHRRNAAARRSRHARGLAARGDRHPRRAGAARLRAGAAGGLAGPLCQRRRRRRRAPRAESARGPHAARRGPRVRAARARARWCCRRTCRRCSRPSRGIGWPAARAPAPSRRSRCCARCRYPRSGLRRWRPQC